MKGKLLINKKADIIWAEPMIVAKVRENTLLYLNPPWIPKYAYKKEEIITADNNNNTTFYSASNSSFFKQSHKLIPNAELKKGELILVRLFEQPNPMSSKSEDFVLNPVAYQATLFEEVSEKKSDMPESGREVKLKQTGFVFQDDITVSEDKEYYKPFTQDIFPNDNNIDLTHVRQTALGDCFLLAAITAALAADGGSAFFIQMMRQGNYFTLVKLFHPISKEPVFLKVFNSFYCEKNDDDTVAHKYPWVHMLEKAYAGFAYRHPTEGEDKHKKAIFLHPSFRAMYGSGGRSELAFTILFGKQAEQIEFYKTFNKTATSMHPWSVNASQCAEAWGVVLPFIKNDANLLNEMKQNWIKTFKQLPKPVHECFPTIDDFIDWGCYLSALKGTSEIHYKELFELLTEMDKQQERMTVHQAFELINFLDSHTPQPPTSIIELFTKYILNPYLDNDSQEYLYHYTGIAESGGYTKKQLQIFNEICSKLANNQLMTASTLPEFKIDVPGLRNSHAYALLDAKKQAIDGKPYYFIRLRNPWGQVGRAYQWDKQDKIDFIREEKAYGTFWIELNDFTRYFRAYTFCDPIPELQLKNTWIAEQKQSKLSKKN